MRTRHDAGDLMTFAAVFAIKQEALEAAVSCR
jgi:hypothetical protein